MRNKGRNKKRNKKRCGLEPATEMQNKSTEMQNTTAEMQNQLLDIGEMRKNAVITGNRIMAWHC